MNETERWLCFIIGIVALLTLLLWTGNLIHWEHAPWNG